MYHYVQMYLNEEKMNNFLYIIMNELNKIRIKIERESLTKN